MRTASTARTTAGTSGWNELLVRLTLAGSQCSRIVVVPVEVDWAHGAEHMRAQHGLTPQEADEAVADIDAVWFDPDPTSKSGHSVRVIGYSRSRQTVLTVILVHRRRWRLLGCEWLGVARRPA